MAMSAKSKPCIKNRNINSTTSRKVHIPRKIDEGLQTESYGEVIEKRHEHNYAIENCG